LTSALERGDGVNRLGPRKARQQGDGRGADAEQDEAMAEDQWMEFTVEELREFLQADLLDVQVDPRFKERLKHRLWELVREQARRRRPTDDA